MLYSFDAIMSMLSYQCMCKEGKSSNDKKEFIKSCKFQNSLTAQTEEKFETPFTTEHRLGGKVPVSKLPTIN